MDIIMKEFAELLTTSWFMILINIIIIDIIMSWDNAIIIWLATSKLKWKERKKAIFFWILLATILRIILSIFATLLLGIVWLKFAWWLLLLYVVWKFYKELRVWSSESHETSWNTNLLRAIYTIIIADISMSLDNVLAISWASHGNIVALGLWLVVSIILMAFASSYIAGYLEKYPQIQWVWLFVILIIAMEMIIVGSTDLTNKVFHFNTLPFATFLIGALFIVLHQKYIKPMNEQKLKNWLSEKYMLVIIFITTLLLTFIFLGNIISAFLNSHKPILYTLLVIILFIILELVSLYKSKMKLK